MKDLVKYFAKQSTLVNVVTVFVFILGIYSLFKIKRETFPNIDFDVVQVLTVYPGASPETVEKLITNPLEQALLEVEGIKKANSVSTESTSLIFMTLDPDVTTSDKAKQDIKDIVDSWASLPDTAEDPVVTKLESKKRPVITIALTGDVDEKTLRETAKRIEAPLERLRDVAHVNFEGVRDFEIQVEVDLKKLKRFDISFNELMNALSSTNVNIPGGTIEAVKGQSEMIVRTVGEFEDKEDVANTVVRANALGKPIYVKDIANVTLGFEKLKTLTRVNGQRSVGVTVVKKESGDIIRLVKQVKALMQNELADNFDKRIGYHYINDQSFFVKRRLKVLSNNLGVGLILVLVILSLVLPVRIALITAFGIPFAFLAAIGLMYLGGFSINLISMMGLIIVVGMLVDDAVVVTENAQRSMEEGRKPLDAAIHGTNQIMAPVTASVLTTIMAFGPLVFMSGIFGKFVQSIPVGVILALLVSLFECFFILPNHIGHWVKDRPGNQAKGVFSDFWTDKVLPAYASVLSFVLKFRYGVIFGLFIFFIATGALFKTQMKFILFPPGSIDRFTIRVEAEVATPLKETSENIQPIEKILLKLDDDELQDFKTIVGRHSSGGGRSSAGGHYAQITVYLTPEFERARSTEDIISQLKKEIGNPKAFKKITFNQRSGGPPVGKGVAIGVRGESYDRIMKAVEEIKPLLAQEKGVSDIEDTFRPGKDEIHVNVNYSEASASGLSLSTIGRTVRAAYEGLVPTSIKKLSEEIPVRVRLPQSAREDSKALAQLEIPNARGQRIPLNRIATFDKKKSLAAFEHEGNERQILVEAEIDNDQNSSRAVNQSMKEKLKSVRKKYPDLTFFFGGENQDTKESMQSLATTFAFAFLGIFFLLIILFQNIVQPLLITMTIPIGIASVIWAFYFHGLPLSFLGSIGIIALAGVIVNNSIVLTDFVNTERANGNAGKKSILLASKTRLRPIFLTTLTTVAGILPTAYGWGGLDPFVVPIAVALGWGLAFGSVLVTIIFPVLFAISDDLVWMIGKIKSKIIPSSN
ncbi:efflux RND transporter permease subunit [bacterium]|nr:efflux RND transporter permease subunit [bacterium]